MKIINKDRTLGFIIGGCIFISIISAFAETIISGTFKKGDVIRVVSDDYFSGLAY